MITKATIKHIQQLQQKKYRDEKGIFFAEGSKVVIELLNHNVFECQAVYCTQKWHDELSKSLAIKLVGNINIIQGFELEKISAMTLPNNVLAVFKKAVLPDNIDFKNKISIVLDDIQDPGNLGTIIRIADWFGIENIICSLATADCYNPKVVQSTMASLGNVNMYYKDVLLFLENQNDIKKYAATLDGNNIKPQQKLKEGIIIIGNESKGISDKVLHFADEKISIQKIGKAESLNAAVATGIILHSLV